MTASRYGITLEDVIALRAKEVCDVCGCRETRMCGRGQESFAEVRALSIDHNATTGKIRGVLCAGCNVAIGICADDPARLRALADYLERG